MQESFNVRWYACRVECENCGEVTLIATGVPSINYCHMCGNGCEREVIEAGGHEMVSVIYNMISVDYKGSLNNREKIGTALRDFYRKVYKL